MEASSMSDEEIVRAFDTDFFWLLVRRFSVASAGEAREAAKKSILGYIANNVGERELKL